MFDGNSIIQLTIVGSLLVAAVIGTGLWMLATVIIGEIERS